MAPHSAQSTTPPAVEVLFDPAGIALVRLRGEHDLSGRPRLNEALMAASDQGNVLVDLSECTFMDSSVITAFFLARKRLSERDGGLELVIPREATTLQRIAAFTALAAILPIHDTRAAGVASLRAADRTVDVWDLHVSGPDARVAQYSVM